MPIRGTPTERKAQVFKEFGQKNLHSGKGGPVVKNRKQAIAIALSEAGLSRKKKSKRTREHGLTSTRRGNQHVESETHAYHY